MQVGLDTSKAVGRVVGKEDEEGETDGSTEGQLVVKTVG
jgi:hypothetical protein